MDTDCVKASTLDAQTDCPHGSCCTGCRDCDDGADDSATSPSHFTSAAADLVWIVFWTLVLGSLLSAPHWLWVMAHWNDSTVPVPMGVVQQVHFIGDWGINTQIDTEDRSLVVRGMTRLEKGSRVELHKTLDSLQLCAVDADRAVLRCENLI